MYITCVCVTSQCRQDLIMWNGSLATTTAQDLHFLCPISLYNTCVPPVQYLHCVRFARQKQRLRQLSEELRRPSIFSWINGQKTRVSAVCLV